METPATADIVIIGGGVMGASAAYHLAKCGIKNIVLLEKEEFFGTGATGRCAGGVRYQFFTEINVKLSLKSLPMNRAFQGKKSGQDVDYRPGRIFGDPPQRDKDGLDPSRHKCGKLPNRAWGGETKIF